MSLFCRQGEGGHTKIEGVIVDVLTVIVVSTTDQAQEVRVWMLGEEPTKGPLQRGETNNRQVLYSIAINIFS